MKKIIKKFSNRDFLIGLAVGFIAGALLCPFKKGLITINSYNENNSECQNAVHAAKDKEKRSKTEKE